MTTNNRKVTIEKSINNNLWKNDSFTTKTGKKIDFKSYSSGILINGYSSPYSVNFSKFETSVRARVIFEGDFNDCENEYTEVVQDFKYNLDLIYGNFFCLDAAMTQLYEDVIESVKNHKPF